MANGNASGIIVQRIRYDYTVNVTTAAWTQLDAALDENCRYAEIFDSSGQTMKLGLGAAGAESDVLQILPGGNGLVPLRLPAGARLSVKAVSATATAGELTINLHY